MAKVLIWGKTYPELSFRHRETVCTGGCTEDGKPIRLYPVPLRYLPEVERYKLYSWIDAPLADSKSDSRPESKKLVRPEIDVLQTIPPGDGWAARREVIFRDLSWHYECLEDLKARQQEDRTSMGFVPVGAVDWVKLEARPEEDRVKHEQKFAGLRALAKQRDLFQMSPETAKLLAFQTHRVRVGWRCKRLDGPNACPGHTASVLDWGLGELGRRKGWGKALQKMQDISDLNEYELAFFCGNFKRYPSSFGIVGIWYPKRSHVARHAAKGAQKSLF